MVHDRIDDFNNCDEDDEGNDDDDGGGGWRCATHSTIALFSLCILENNLFIGLIGLIHVDFILFFIFSPHILVDSELKSQTTNIEMDWSTCEVG